MSNNTNNSLSTLISQFLMLEKNAFEVFNKLNEAITSNKKTVDIDLFDQNNNLVKIQVPSFGFLKNEISRLDNNIKNLSGVGDSDTNVRLSDGTYRKIITSKLKTPAKQITSINIPTTFNSKANWFFEQFINPLLYITIDVSGQIPIDTEKILVKRYILTLDTDKKKQFFKDNYKNKDGFSYVDFMNDIIAQNISFILDEEVLDIPPRSLRYVGNFSVLRIQNKQIDKLINGQIVKQRSQIYKLDKLTYTDLNSGFTDSVSLKIGDSLIVNNERKNTRYIVTSIDSSTNEVSLELVEGYDAVNIGASVLSIYKGQEDNIQLEIPIGFDENVVIFIKSIDPVSKIPSEFWSPGIAFYTNELKIIQADGNVQTLETYYKNEVADIGNILLGLAKDKIPSSIYGITPDPPVLDVSNFRVEQINKHLTDNDSFKEVQQSHNEKNRLSAEIKEIDVAIKHKRSLISTKKYENKIERQADLKELQNLIEQHSNLSKLYSSIVNNIVDKAKGENLVKITPKYRVRGFWSIPEPKVSKYTNPQEVVQFIIQYRYLSNNGRSNNISQLKFKDNNNVERSGSFSNWNEIITKARKRVKNEITGQYEWKVEDVENADSININQLDIPIQPNESVEIRIKSVSEAGYPTNPKESDWSNSIIISFPQELMQTNNLQTIKEESIVELAKVKLIEELESRGVNDHLSSSYSVNEYYYAHDATVIASGFLSPEQKPINLYDKLIELENRINELQSIINRVTGELVVKILDENGIETLIENNSSNKFFAGYYVDQIKDRDIKKGSIVTKTYFITLENKVATPLEILSRMPGNRLNQLPISGGLFNTITTFNDSYYTTRGHYDFVPILYTNPDLLNNITFNSPFQSAQRNGQYIYARWFNVAGNDEFYVDFDIDMPSTIITSVDDAEYSLSANSINSLEHGESSPTNFIWSGTYHDNKPTVINLTNDMSGTPDNITYTAYNSGLFVHWMHPNIVNSNGNYTAVMAHNDLRMAKPATLQSSNIHSKKQNGYFYDVNVSRTLKCSFEPNDQYLLGGKSCGAYMFIAVNNEKSLQVNGDDDLSSIKIQMGQNNAIQIPLVYQYRMTDFAGVGTDGLGFIAGDCTGSTKDVTYSKKMGFDIKLINGNMFRFDIEIFSKYRNNNLNIDKLPKRDITLAIEDLRQTLKGGVVPNIIERSTKDVSGIK